MTTATINYGTPTALTFTLASLASDTNLVAGRESTAVDNTTTKAIDYLVGGTVVTGTTPTTARQIEVWLYGMYDGTEYGGSATGTDANLTPDEKSNLAQLRVIPTIATSDKEYQWGPFSVAQAFGGPVPQKWGIYIVHNTGVNLKTTGHEAYYTAIKYDSA